MTKPPAELAIQVVSLAPEPPVPEPPGGRQCGGCTMCCRLIGVRELEKPARHPCPHCAAGKGCTIYDVRPESCRVFRCGWLQGAVPLAMKPDRARVVITGMEGDRAGIYAHLAPGVALADRQHPTIRWLLAVAQQLPVFVTEGDFVTRVGPRGPEETQRWDRLGLVHNRWELPAWPDVPTR